MAAEVTRYPFEVLASVPPTANVTRFTGIAVAEDAAGDDPTALISVTRYDFEVLAETPPAATITRFTEMAVAESAAVDDPNALVSVTRYTFETLAMAEFIAAVTRFTAMAVAEAVNIDVPDGVVSVTRYTLEVLAPRFIQLSTCALPPGLEYFANNWANSVEIETTYRTDITRGAQSVAEERIQLWERPERTVKLRWTEIGPGEKTNLERLLNDLRRQQCP